jgi:hypothetical protein
MGTNQYDLEQWSETEVKLFLPMQKLYDGFYVNKGPVFRKKQHPISLLIESNSFYRLCFQIRLRICSKDNRSRCYIRICCFMIYIKRDSKCYVRVMVIFRKTTTKNHWIITAGAWTTYNPVPARSGNIASAA